MAERIVLATLDIDESGAVRSVKAVEQGIGQLGNQTKSTADVFTARMFSMRSAAQAFLGTFTVAGGIYALKGLLDDATRANAHFLTLQVSAQNFRDAMAVAVGHVFGLNAALPETSSLLDRMAEHLTRATSNMEKARAGTLQAYPKGMAPEDFYGPPAPPGIRGYGYDPDASAKAFKELQARRQFVIENAVALTDYELAVISTIGSLDALNDYVEENGLLLRGTAEAFGEATSGIEDYTIGQFSAAEAVAHLSFTLSEMGMVAQAAGQALGTLASSGTRNLSRLIAQALGFVAALAWSRVATYTAAAAAASTGLGAAVEGGTPGQFAVSAALWKKVALVSTFAAAALGSFSSGGSAGGGGEARGGFGGVDVSGGGRAAQSFTFIIHGDVVGKDEWIRDLAAQVSKAARDNAGGTLVFT